MKAALLVLLLFSSSVQAKVFQFLYIEASEGNASGGHVAVQLGEEVYHYQYDNALIRLFKHSAEAFRVNYQLQQNRTIHVADIQVSDATYEQISDYFKINFFRQKQSLQHRQAVQSDSVLLQALLQKQQGIKISKQPADLAVTLPAAGLFYEDVTQPSKRAVSGCNAATSSSKIRAKLKQRLSDKYGSHFLTEKLIRLRKELTGLLPVTNEYSATPQYTFAEHYTDLLNGLLALQVIENNRPLTESACFQLKLAGMQLSEKAIQQAKAYRQKLLTTADSLMFSNRPDWGSALFVSLARLITIEHSIQTRQWIFLDDTDEGIAPIAKQQVSLYSEQMHKQRSVDLQRLHEAVAIMSKDSASYERDYVELEMSANRFQQWLVSERTGELRFRSEQPLPTKSVSIFPFLQTEVSAEQITQALRLKKLSTDRLLEQDTNKNAYHLLSRNCVTTLFKSVNASISGQAKLLLGGEVDPETTFIPFQAFDAVQENYNVVKTTKLTGYRQQKLAKLYAIDASDWLYARESNVFSSSLYRYNSDDAWFVFFTDDTFWLRPLYGAVNILAASSQSVLGLLRLPFDDGREFITGTKGILASLSELAFFNIRKGSYPYPIDP